MKLTAFMPLCSLFLSGGIKKFDRKLSEPQKNGSAFTVSYLVKSIARITCFALLRVDFLGLLIYMNARSKNV